MGFSRSYNWRVGYSVIFTDREIIIAIERGLIIIDPRPNSKYFASTSVDLTLDPVIAKFKPSTPGLETTVDPDHEGFKSDAVLADLTESISIGSDGFLIPPKTLFLAWTKEYVELKTETRVAARVEGKSSLARLGLGVHVTAPTIHAGFKGRIRLEMINHGALSIKLREGMRICQLIFETTLGTPERGYSGQFQGQNSHPCNV